MFTRLFRKYQLKFTFVNFDDVSKIAELINDKTKLIWLETPTNPLMKLVDIKAVADLIQGKDILLAVDNTFLITIPSTAFRPRCGYHHAFCYEISWRSL